MNYKILFLDIDGTILKPDHTYTESTKNAIKQVQEKGIEVFFATGRPLHELEELAKDLGITSGIGYNGGLAMHRDENIINEPIHSNLVQEIVDLAKHHGNELIMYPKGKNLLSSDEPSVREFVNQFNMQKNEQMPEVLPDIYGISVVGVQPDHLQDYQKLENLKVSPVNVEGLNNAYDLIQANINKGTTVKRILDLLQVSKDEAIAFGDGMNDAEMLALVGESFAMANAHPNLFQYAKHKTTSVEESGIFNGLKTLGLVE